MKINICPKCEKENIYFSPKNVCYICEECSNKFNIPLQKVYTPTKEELAAGFDGDKVATTISHLPPVDTRVVEVFLASSTSEAMKDKREIITAAVCLANSQDEGLYIKLYHCEDDDRSDRGKTQQEEYNERIEKCDVFLLLSSNSELGDITLKEEVKHAADQKKQRNNIKLFAFADNGKPTDETRGNNWEYFKKNYKSSFELLLYNDEKTLELKAKEFIDTIRRSDSIGTVYKGCSRVGYNIELIGSDASAKKYLNAIADKLNTLNNRFIERDPYQSLQFKVNIRCGDTNNIECSKRKAKKAKNVKSEKKANPIEEIKANNDNYFVIPCDENDCSKGFKGRVFATIEECFRLAKEKTDVSLFRGENNSGRKYLSDHEKVLSEKMDNNYSFSFSHKDTIVNKPTMNERLSEIREAYASLEEGLYYLHQKNYCEAERRLLIGADFGFPIACFYLGYIYMEMEGFKDYEKAEKYTLLAADAGVVNAMHNISLTYLEKLKNESDPKSNKELIKKIEKYCKLAVKNNMYRACCILGDMYDTVLGRYTDAERMYKKAADKGDPAAQFNLALFYQKKGREKDAMPYYFLAADKGDVKAIVNLASICYKKGYLLAAEQLLALAPDQENSEVLFNTGIVNMQKGNVPEAEEYFKRAADKGQLNALVNLGRLSWQKGNMSEAEGYYKRACAQDYPEALIDLGKLYLNNENMSGAEECFNRVPEENMHEVFLQWGCYYMQKEDLTEAESYFIKAAERGNFEAKYFLGNLLSSKGEFDAAEKYLLEALSVDDREKKSDCENELGILYERKNELDKAEKFFRLSAEVGSSVGEYNLGHLLWKYYGSKRLDEAEEYYRRAAEKGDEDAKRDLEKLLYEVEILPAAVQGQPEALLNMGLINMHKDNLPEAEKYLLEAYAKLSDNDIKLKISCELNLGDLYLRKKEFDFAEKYLSLSADKGHEGAKTALDMLRSVRAGN